MPTRIFTSGRIKKADYDTASQQLDLHWDNKNVLAYKHVPEEVYGVFAARPTRQLIGRTGLQRNTLRVFR